MPTSSRGRLPGRASRFTGRNQSFQEFKQKQGRWQLSGEGRAHFPHSYPPQMPPSESKGLSPTEGGKQPVPGAHAPPAAQRRGPEAPRLPLPFPLPQPLLLLSARRSGSTFWKPVTAEHGLSDDQCRTDLCPSVKGGTGAMTWVSSPVFSAAARSFPGRRGRSRTRGEMQLPAPGHGQERGRRLPVPLTPSPAALKRRPLLPALLSQTRPHPHQPLQNGPQPGRSDRWAALRVWGEAPRSDGHSERPCCPGATRSVLDGAPRGDLRPGPFARDHPRRRPLPVSGTSSRTPSAHTWALAKATRSPVRM